MKWAGFCASGCGWAASGGGGYAKKGGDVARVVRAAGGVAWRRREGVRERRLLGLGRLGHRPPQTGGGQGEDGGGGHVARPVAAATTAAATWAGLRAGHGQSVRVRRK